MGGVPAPHFTLPQRNRADSLATVVVLKHSHSVWLDCLMAVHVFGNASSMLLWARYLNPLPVVRCCLSACCVVCVNLRSYIKHCTTVTVGASAFAVCRGVYA